MITLKFQDATPASVSKKNWEIPTGTAFWGKLKDYPDYGRILLLKTSKAIHRLVVLDDKPMFADYFWFGSEDEEHKDSIFLEYEEVNLTITVEGK